MLVLIKFLLRNNSETGIKMSKLQLLHQQTPIQNDCYFHNIFTKFFDFLKENIEL